MTFIVTYIPRSDDFRRFFKHIFHRPSILESINLHKNAKVNRGLEGTSDIHGNSKTRRGIHFMVEHYLTKNAKIAFDPLR